MPHLVTFAVIAATSAGLAQFNGGAPIPELDPSALNSAFALLVGAALVVRSRLTAKA